MNYGGGSSSGGSSSDDAASSTNNNDAAAAAAAASRWENMLVGNYFGGGDFLNSHDDSAMAIANNSTTAATYDPNDRQQGYATACHLAAAVAGAGFPRHHGNNNGTTTTTTTSTTTNNLFYGYHAPTPPPPTTNNLRNGSPYSMFMTGGGSGNGGSSGGGGQQSHLSGGESGSGGGSSGGGLYHHNPQFDLQFPATSVQQQSTSSTSRRRRRQQHEDGASATSHTGYDQYSTNYDHGNYYNPVETTRIFDRIVTDDNANSGHHHHHHQHQHHPQQPHRNNNNYGTTAAGCGASPDDINLNEMEYCDALLRGVDDSNGNFSWFENVFTTMNGHGGGGGGNGSGGGRSVANNTTTTMTNDAHSAILRRNEYNNERSGISGMLQLFNEQNSGIMGSGADERLIFHGFGDSPQDTGRRMMSHQHQQQQQTSHKERPWGDQGDRGGGHNNTALEAYIVAQLRQQQKQLHHDTKVEQMQQQHQRLLQRQHKETSRPHTSHSASEVRSSRHKLPKTTSSSSTASAATTSSSRLPSRADHSSLPSAQIDPILERISLTVTAVSLTPMSGNEVVRHIRNKTDDVITRFLPCVDFLVNCQQELRQGLALAQQQQQQQQQRGRRGASRNNTVITPRQFHTSYVAPLPNRFKRQYEPIMASEHLHHAIRSLESLVKDAAVATPQGIDHVKNAFLGGMRENQSWGLRKWLSEHGGAGSICNDVEEVMRHVKALKRDEETTKRLAEMLRPIARQAHDRLKKDVPSAYQEKSSAHPYLPFFHRLEACLKQMATYDPEEDDVICLEDSDDEDEDVTVLSKKTGAQAPVAATSRSPVPNRPTMAKDSFISKWADSFAEGGRGNDAKRSRLDLGAQTDNEDQHVGERCEDADRVEKGKPKEPEVICLVDSDDEEDESDSLAQKNAFNIDFGRLDSLSPPPPLARNNVADAPLNSSQHGTSAEAIITKEGEQWRCVQCTFLNEAFAKQCVMCNDDDSANGANSADDLANFLGGGSFLLEGESCNHSFNGSDQFLQVNCLTPTNHFTTGTDQHKWRALQSADARELECLAEHISGGGSLPNQAHMQTDQFWAKSDTFPQILLLFRSILQHPTSHRFLEPVNETQLFMMGSPEYTSIVKHPLCFHEIVSALSRSEDAVKHPYLTMRLSNGKLAVANMGELEHWNMWNGLHLIEAIDLVLLNSLAYNGSLENSGQLQIETESLRDLLWEGVNSMLKRLQPHRRRDHLPQRRSVDSGFVVVKADRR